MPQLLEIIKVENKTLYNLKYHNERFNRTRAELFNKTEFLDLADVIKFPDDMDMDLYKCRVVYNTEIIKVDFVTYQPRIVKSLKVVNGNHIRYDYKYCDREEIRSLRRKAKCSETEEILIIKEGRITDTSYSNVVLFDGKKWITPVHPILRGTTRARLIDEGLVTEEEIFLSDLKRFQGVKLINAMVDFDKQIFIPLSDINTNY